MYFSISSFFLFVFRILRKWSILDQSVSMTLYDNEYDVNDVDVNDFHMRRLMTSMLVIVMTMLD